MHCTYMAINLRAHICQKWKSTFLFYVIKAVKQLVYPFQLNFQIIIIIIIFLSMWNLGQFCEKTVILSVSTCLNFKSRTSLAHTWHIQL